MCMQVLVPYTLQIYFSYLTTCKGWFPFIAGMTQALKNMPKFSHFDVMYCIHLSLYPAAMKCSVWNHSTGAMECNETTLHVYYLVVFAGAMECNENYPVVFGTTLLEQWNVMKPPHTAQRTMQL